MNRPGLPRWLCNTGLLLSGIASTASGFLLQIHYHMGHATSAVGGYGYVVWSRFHQLASFALVLAVAWHLFRNGKPFWALVHRRAAWRKQVMIFTLVFLLALTTASAGVVAFLVFDHRTVERIFVEIHDKIALPLFVLLVLHTWSRRSRLYGRPGH